MPSQAIATSARTLSRLAEADGDAGVVLLDADAIVVEQDGVAAKLGARRFVQNEMQLAAMDADFRILIAGEFAARLLVDELAETVEEAAFAVLDAGREQRVADAERGELAHGMRQ